LHQKELDDRAYHGIDQLHRRFENQNLTYLLHQIKTYKKDIECEMRAAKQQYYRELNGTTTTSASSSSSLASSSSAASSTTANNNNNNNTNNNSNEGLIAWFYSLLYVNNNSNATTAASSSANQSELEKEKEQHGILTILQMLKLNPDTNWAEVWLHRRNNNDPRAKEIELCRVRSKASFYMLKQTLERHMSRKKLFDEFLYDDPLNKRYVEMFLHYVEPMDRARCKSHGNSCVWERDEPAVYHFLREEYKIDKNKSKRSKKDDDVDEVSDEDEEDVNK